MKSINTMLNNAYKGLLAPYGFKKIKGKYPYFVRLIDDEIVHVITYKQERMIPGGPKAFSILCGVATVYRKQIEFDISPRDNVAWLSDTSSFQSNDEERVRWFGYDAQNENSMKEAVDFSCKITKENILPALDSVKNFKDCLDFYRKYNPNVMFVYLEDDFGMARYNEGLLNSIVYGAEKYEQYVEDLRNEINKEHEQWEEWMKNGKIRLTKERFEKRKIEDEERLTEEINNLKKIVFETEWKEKAAAELEHRKSVNTEILRNCGVEIL